MSTETRDPVGWEVTAPDGSLWASTSDEADARRRMRPGDRLWHVYVVQHLERVEETP